jgi:hypothetical protein
MAILKSFGMLALALGGALVALWHRRRAATAPKRVHPRRFVSRRIVDRDARDQQALVRWDDDGGANDGGANTGGANKEGSNAAPPADCRIRATSDAKATDL